MYLNQSEIKYLRSLQKKKFRDAERKFLLEGWNPLGDALNSDFKIELIAVLPEVSKKSPNAQLLTIAKKRNIPIKELKEIQIKQLSDTMHSQGVVALVKQRTHSFNPEVVQSANLIVACDGVSDPGNLGTILRTCDWFGVDAVLLSEGCVSLYNEKVVRSTAGSIFHLKVFEEIDFDVVLSNLRLNGFTLIVTTLNGKPLDSIKPAKKSIILLGNEAHGAKLESIHNADELVSIPRFGKAESLNVGIACGIFLAHCRNQIPKNNPVSLQI